MSDFIESQLLLPKAEVILKPGREKSLRNRHPWVFSGAIQSAGKCEPGSIVTVLSSTGEFLGLGYINPASSIRIRMLSFKKQPLREVLLSRLNSALELRAALLSKDLKESNLTTAARLINGEGDGFPGLIVDSYGGHLVVQIGTLGMERLKPWLLNELSSRLSPSSIYEKSNLPSRKEEGLDPIEQSLFGETPSEVVVKENGLEFSVDIVSGQKTGFFIDQREMRSLVKNISSAKSVLNCFCYTGGFSVYAQAGGAKRVDSVDSSKKAVEIAEQNCRRNRGFSEESKFVATDAFKFLEESKELYDLIILDPPAFAKKRDHLKQGMNGYVSINTLGLRRLAPGGTLLTCSCSHFLDETRFQEAIFQACRSAGREAKIIDRHHYAIDHPVSIYHPEGSYLKSLLLVVI